MKWLKRAGIAFLSLPILLIVIFVFYELFGMYVNHMTTKRQTQQLRTNLEKEIADIEIVDIYLETGNTSGTGNHVDCLSSITFSTKLQEQEIEDKMSAYYLFDDWSCYIDLKEEGNYLFYFNTSALFADNIEGH